MSAYKHSGAAGLSLVLGPPLILVASFVSALVYAYINVWSPIAGYISLLFVAGFAFLLALSVRLIAKLAKCRNTGIAMALGGLAGVTGLYFSWAIFVYALLSRYDDAFDAAMLDVILQPAAVWAIMLEINETGWYSIWSSTPTGAVLWAFWGIEALVVIGGGVAGGLAALHEEVYCEHCGTWCAEDPASPRLVMPDSGIDPALAQVTPEALERLAPFGGGQEAHLRVTIRKCNGCSRTHTAQLQLLRYEANEKGEVSEKTESAGEIHELSLEAYRRVVALANRTFPAAEALPVPFVPGE